MTKTIDTLLEDIDQVLLNGAEITDEQAEKFAKALVNTIKTKISPESREYSPTLRMSNIGRPCERQLWYQINQAEEGEPMPPNAYMKFLMGDIIEEVVLMLAELAGHTVEGGQDEMEIAGIKGHRDAVISGTLVDVKSASPYSFTKFKEGTLSEDDAFGYIPQLSSYLQASQDDPKVTDKDRAAFLVFNKVTGDLALDFHSKRGERDQYVLYYEAKKAMVKSDTAPERSFDAVAQSGTSPNKKLGVNCSYCNFKYSCWPELRTFLSSRGPVFLTEVEKEPRMVEIDRDGNLIEKEE
jgi:CRISPR/Cas system-associated exonuclease Cas4 (RecB family)